MERKTRFACRCGPLRGLALVLFALFGCFATAAQAMLLTLDLRWNATDAAGLLAYHLQEGSIVQVIGYKDHEIDPTDPNQWRPDLVNDPYFNFDSYGMNSVSNYAQPYTNGTSNIPDTPGTVYLADTTPDGHDILYTGSIQKLTGTWYGLYTQITVDKFVYDTVYIRVFGATNIEQGEVTASYWGGSDVYTLNPSYQTDKLQLSDVHADGKNYFEVIPEPATAGLLGLGGIALAAWRRRRSARSEAGMPVRMEE